MTAVEIFGKLGSPKTVLDEIRAIKQKRLSGILSYSGQNLGDFLIFSK